MSEFLLYLADNCTKIMNNPEENVKEISHILSNQNHKDIIYLSLAKVFKHIVPLYKIRLHSTKIKHKIDDNSISQYDRDLLDQYNIYIKEICASNISESFKAACELVKSLDHFNFIDRLISKILIGTKYNQDIGLYCINTLVDRIKNDIVGDTVFLILNQCLDYDYNFKIIEALLESRYLAKCVEIRIDKEEKYNKQKIKQKELNAKPKKEKGFFKKENIYSHSERKELKKVLQQLSATKNEEDNAMEQIEDKNYIRTVNALQRVYFTILKNNMQDCYEYTMKGIVKYIRIIRKEFHEGLYILLTDAIKNTNIKARIEGMLCILKVYGKTGLDFKTILDLLYKTIHPLNFELQSSYFDSIGEIINMLLIDTKQSVSRAIAISQRLIQSRCFRYVPQYVALVKKIEIAYDLDYLENDIRNKKVGNIALTDIDKVEPKPFYEYQLFKKVL